MTKDLAKIYFTSDWHIGHANVLQFDQRPFRDMDHMNRVLVNNYNSTVGDNDTVYFLGDMGLGNSESLTKVVKELKGKKILILGNHDKGIQSMTRIGFLAVMYSSSLVIANQLVTMTHCPLRGVWREDASKMNGYVEGDNWHKEHKHKNFSIPDFGQFHLHGHTHKLPAERILDRQMDVGVRANDYRPVSISTVESWVVRSRGKK